MAGGYVRFVALIVISVRLEHSLRYLRPVPPHNNTDSKCYTLWYTVTAFHGAHIKWTSFDSCCCCVCSREIALPSLSRAGITEVKPTWHATLLYEARPRFIDLGYFTLGPSSRITRFGATMRDVKRGASILPWLKTICPRR